MDTGFSDVFEMLVCSGMVWTLRLAVLLLYTYLSRWADLFSFYFYMPWFPFNGMLISGPSNLLAV